MNEFKLKEQICEIGRRVYNKGFERGKDSNHRLTTDRAIYDKMIGAGWSGENVVMCSPKS